MNRNLFQDAVDEIGHQPIAAACGLTRQAVRKWRKKGLPRTEWTGETNYAAAIERLSSGKYARGALLSSSEELKRAAS